MSRQNALRSLFFLLFVAIALPGCENPMKKKEEELAKNTFACQLNGERFVVRFVDGEARILMPGAERVTLYQLHAMSGVRYSNGNMELRGKGTALQVIMNGTVTPLRDCEPYAILPPAK